MPGKAKANKAPENSTANNGVRLNVDVDELEELIGVSKRGRKAQPSVYTDTVKAAIASNAERFAVEVTERRQYAWIRTQLDKAAKECGLEPRKDYSILDRSASHTKTFPNGAAVFVFRKDDDSE